MIFNETTYFLFFLFPAVLTFHWVGKEAKPWVLTAFGIAFFTYYGAVHFGGAWGAACVLIFVWELATSRLYQKGSRWCLFGIAQSIVILVAFKYLVFFSGAWNDVAPHLYLPPIVGLKRVVLPLGVSFFTFEFIHFAVESYRGTIVQPALSRYASFIFFFPTMVAGPIKRYGEYEEELVKAKWDANLALMGITRILAGLAKKHVLADTFSLWADRLNSDAIFSAGKGSLLFWILCYGFKIYFDFSGYSDIAIGSGNLFGIKIPENFNWPYLSQNISDFWRRWHVSLGRWIFDYIYAPLGGSRRGIALASVNLLIAFAISGLWHGAAYNFLAWGLWHGALMVIHRLWKSWSANRRVVLAAPFSTALTFCSVNLGWTFFCVDFSRAILIFEKLLGVA